MTRVRPRFFGEKSPFDLSAKDHGFSQKIGSSRNFRRKFGTTLPSARPDARPIRKDLP